MLNNLLNLVGLAGQGQWGNRQQARVQSYVRYKRMYDGYVIRQDDNGVQQWKPLRYNLARPIIDVTADFMASKEISWTVTDDEEATQTMDKIWTESGGSSTFMSAALLGSILGDMCIMVCKESDEDCACLRWVDPSICYPEFEAHDTDKLLALVIAYEIVGPDGKNQRYKEDWRQGQVKIYLDDKLTDTQYYDEKLYGGVPAVWIRNNYVKSDIFGRSDLQPIGELVEQYDHLCEKQSRIIDYYAAPNIYIKGVTKKQIEMTKGERTMYFIPEGAEIGFIEWHGTAPSVDLHIDRVREAISEVSETPQIAFSKLDSGVSNVSGIAIKLLYGPLLAKTERKRQSWGPPMERAMQMALIAEGYTDIELDQISIEWPNPLPTSEVEDWQVAAEKSAMGVSKDQILREAGYTQDEIDQFKQETQNDQSAQDALLMKQFAAGQVPGLPYPGGNPSPKPGQMPPKQQQQEQK